MVTPDSTFGDVINLASHARTHRVWVVDQNHKPIGVVSLVYLVTLILLTVDRFPLRMFVELSLSFTSHDVLYVDKCINVNKYFQPIYDSNTTLTYLSSVNLLASASASSGVKLTSRWP